MKRSSKRLWSVLLTLAMLLSIAPVSAYAAGPWWGWLGGDTEPYSSGSYVAYYYVLDPTVSDGDSRNVDNFIFIGKGSVSNQLGAPDSGYNKGGIVSIDDNNKSYMTVPKSETQTFGTRPNQVFWTTYPNITHDGQEYVYKGKDPAGTSSTYSIVWYRYSSSTGYNIYDHGKDRDYRFDESTYCWHVDGRIEFSDKVSVTYLVCFPGDSTPSSVSSKGEKIPSATYTSYKEEGTAFSEFGKPNMSDKIEDSAGNKYNFKGWYSDASCTTPIEDNTEINESITAYGKYEKIDESKPSSITVEVYVDGDKVILTDDNLRQYLIGISVAPGTLDNGEVTVSKDGSLTVPFKYSVYDAVDLKISLNENYALQGAAGSFIYGEGWKNPMFYDGGWIIDNIDGGSTLKLYLNTLYSVKYYLDGSETGAPSDTEKYVTGQGVSVTTITAESFNPEQHDVAVSGTLRNPSLNYELELEGVPTGYTGWYKTDRYEDEDMHTAPYTGTAIATAAGADKVVDCYGKKNTYTVSYQLTSTDNPTDSTLPVAASHYAGDQVTVAGRLTTNETEKNGVSGTWTFNGWTSTDVTVTDGKFTMPERNVVFTGSWKFTANTHNITINYVDEDSGILKTAYSTTQNDGDYYSFTVSSDKIPLTITNDNGQYVFDHFAAGSAALSGTLKGDVTITAVYLLDSDKDGTPDAYEATVTYKIVNGTWSDDTSADKTEKFTLKTFDTTTNTWKANDPTLGDTIPTGMKPGEAYLADGSWDETISADTEVTGDVTYTYSFNTAKAPGLSVEKSVVSVGGVEVAGGVIPAAIAGDVIEYKIVITNTGNVPLADVQVSDNLWTAGTTITVGSEVEQLTDTAYTIGELAVGGSVTISYNYTVKATDESKVKNTATASADGNVTGSDTATEVVVYDPVTPPVTPSEPDYKPEWLNTEDHYAYIIGYEDGTVRPYGSITRAETATIFFRLLTDEAREECWTETNSYTDVSRGDWYNTAVSTLSRLGILGGYEDGTFRPNSGITRAEFAKIAVNFFEYEGIEAENVFTDVAHGSWYEDFVAAAAEIGLIEGYEDGSFRPESGITRAEACTIINRTLGRAPDKGHLLPESEMLTWPDNPESAWYYAQIQEATNSHEYKWLGAIEQWLKKLPERDWAA